MRFLNLENKNNIQMSKTNFEAQWHSIWAVYKVAQLGGKMSYVQREAVTALVG